jgi:hypothetical protein
MADETEATKSAERRRRARGAYPGDQLSSLDTRNPNGRYGSVANIAPVETFYPEGDPRNDEDPLRPIEPVSEDQSAARQSGDARAEQVVASTQGGSADHSHPFSQGHEKEKSPDLVHQAVNPREAAREALEAGEAIVPEGQEHNAEVAEAEGVDAMQAEQREQQAEDDPTQDPAADPSEGIGPNDGDAHVGGVEDVPGMGDAIVGERTEVDGDEVSADEEGGEEDAATSDPLPDGWESENKDTILEYARERGVEVSSSARKAELVAALKEWEEDPG